MQPLKGGEPRERFLAVFGSLFPKGEWPQSKLDNLLSYLHFRDLEAGATLLREGQACASVPFVTEGSIRVFKTAESGREITLYRVEKGQSCILSVGCGSSIKSFPASAIVEEATSAAFMPTETVRRLFAESETFRDFVLDQYSRRMADVMELVEEVAFRRVDQRLAQWLVERSSTEHSSTEQGSGIVSATHQELASHVGTSREVVSRILKDWEERGALELSRGSIKLLPGFEKLRSM
jgi:CRP/FNR family transcriptional regulator, anaerobic regulatory protein